MLKYTLITILSILFLMPLSAEQKRDITITGKIIDANSSDPIEYATVSIYNLSDSLITGTITQNDGSFELGSPLKDFYIQIKFMGYESLTINQFNIKGNKVDIASHKLSPHPQKLGEVEVRAEKSQLEFKMDKRIFNVGQDLTSVGGSALDVLNNVPSVDVNIEGEVSLRGNSNVQMLINGKPSVLTDGNSLGTITADMIDKIEVVTNPSAKYDAEGTSGIINIVIKKEDKEGLNGAISLNTGYPANHSVGLSMNRRTDKFNLFSQFGVGKRTFIPAFSGETTDRTRETPSTFYNEGTGYKDEQFYNVILGTDYHINEWSVITLSGHYAFEIEDQGSETKYWTKTYGGTVNSQWQREEITEATNPKYQYELNYKKSFERHEDQSLTASATGAFFGKDSKSLYLNTSTQNSSVSPNQQVATDYGNADYSFMTDYVHPFTEGSVLEAGAKYNIQQLNNDYLLENDRDGEWMTDPDYTNIFNYTQKVAATYITYAWEPNKLGIKIGSRLEHTQLNTELKYSNKETNQQYTNLFPSAHLSYKINSCLSFQTGYSRRISRPSWRSLNPFSSFRDNYNLSMGNPTLKPEFTDAFELTAIQIWDKASLNASVFYHYTNDVITYVIDVQDSLTLRYPENIGESYNTGVELNGKIEPLNWFALLLDANFMAYNRNGEFNDEIYDFNSSNWSSRITTKFKFPKEVDAEVVVRYRSKYRNIQSTSQAQTYADFGIKKKLLKGRAVVNLSVRDIFASRTSVSLYDTPEFYRYSERMRDGRRIILGFSYGFGKGEAMEFSGQKMF